jgi:xanthine dehydrogenase small subunit
VVLGQAKGGAIEYRAINSCIRLAHSIDGMALWTVEDIAADDGGAHPVQQSMLAHHASQCGFCTPGFVMSLFGMYQNHVCQGETITREMAQQELSGNLCRCTGYRPILDAATTMGDLPMARVDEAALLRQLKQLKRSPLQVNESDAYQAPLTLAALLEARAAHPDAQIVAGCTDVGLWINKLHMSFAKVLDLSRVQELRRVERYPQHIAIGAAVTLSDAFEALCADRAQLNSFFARFAGLPVRNSGTLGGNVANGSPIGDSMPLLIALGANVVLMSVRGHREFPLEQLYTGYRRNQMAADEVLAWIKVPRPKKTELLKVYKISKRFDDDISALCLALQLHITDGVVQQVSIGVGGVAATPVRAVKTEAALRLLPWTQATVREAMEVLRAEFSPISDMRASAAYRSEVLGNLLQRYWLESQGQQQINLESFQFAGAST